HASARNPVAQAVEDLARSLDERAAAHAGFESSERRATQQLVHSGDLSEQGTCRFFRWERGRPARTATLGGPALRGAELGTTHGLVAIAVRFPTHFSIEAADRQLGKKLELDGGLVRR